MRVLVLRRREDHVHRIEAEEHLVRDNGVELLVALGLDRQNGVQDILRVLVGSVGVRLEVGPGLWRGLSLTQRGLRAAQAAADGGKALGGSGLQLDQQSVDSEHHR